MPFAGRFQAHGGAFVTQALGYPGGESKNSAVGRSTALSCRDAHRRHAPYGVGPSGPFPKVNPCRVHGSWPAATRLVIAQCWVAAETYALLKGPRAIKAGFVAGSRGVINAVSRWGPVQPRKAGSLLVFTPPAARRVAQGTSFRPNGPHFFLLPRATAPPPTRGFLKLFSFLETAPRTEKLAARPHGCSLLPVDN